MSKAKSGRTHRAFVSACAWAALLCGCAATPPSITTPRVEVVGLTPLRAAADRQHFRLSLLVDNQNTEPLAIAEVRFTLRIAGEGQIQGRSAPVTVPALTRETVQLEVDSDTISSVSRLQAVVQGPANTLPYDIYGNIVLDRTFQNTLPFSFSGVVPLSMTAQ